MNQITKNTSISIALVVALCGSAFWTGTIISDIRANVRANRVKIESVEELTRKMSSLAESSNARLNILEDRLDRGN